MARAIADIGQTIFERRPPIRPLARRLAERVGLAQPIRYPRRGYDGEEQALRAVELVDDFTMTTYERLVTLWQQVRFLDATDVPGSLVECGTWRGGAVGMMALAHQSSGPPTRRVHLFDSFEGLPEPGALDGENAVAYASGRANGQLTSIGRCLAPLDDSRHLLEGVIGYPTELLAYHVGWFQQTLPAAAGSIGPIALLRLDGDWYESTRVCLEYLVPQVVPGGFVVIDDYGHWPGCRRAVDEYLARLHKPPFLHHIDASARYFVVA